ncbi:hypothetical protein JAGODDHD_00500 [Sphingomonas paucimobilis]|nr:hypothetical protein [Sphingomonas paucimobilis]SUJ31386.1 Uncharacterised protein [Sphingomonas paucimobilis]
MPIFLPCRGRWQPEGLTEGVTLGEVGPSSQPGTPLHQLRLVPLPLQGRNPSEPTVGLAA